MNHMLDILVFAALPASGKSEVRRYLDGLPPEVLQRDFHLGPTVQLNDFPYVYLMRRIDQYLEDAGRPPLFFPSAERPFRDPREWGTLIELLNEDYEFLETRDIPTPPSAAYYYLQRLDEARVRAGLDADLSKLNSRTRARVAASLEREAAHFLDSLRSAASSPLEGKTVVIEIARGGPRRLPDAALSSARLRRGALPLLEENHSPRSRALRLGHSGRITPQERGARAAGESRIHLVSGRSRRSDASRLRLR
jgi:hypothetical protein